jgi:hypothetical protein
VAVAGAANLVRGWVCHRRCGRDRHRGRGGPARDAGRRRLRRLHLDHSRGQIRRFQELTYLPTLRSVFDSPELEVPDEYFGGQQTIDVFRAIVDDVPDYYQSPDSSILTDVLSGHLISAYRGDETPAQAIKGAVADFTNQAGR